MNGGQRHARDADAEKQLDLFDGEEGEAEVAPKAVKEPTIRLKPKLEEADQFWKLSVTERQTLDEMAKTDEVMKKLLIRFDTLAAKSSTDLELYLKEIAQSSSKHQVEVEAARVEAELEEARRVPTLREKVGRQVQGAVEHVTKRAKKYGAYAALSVAVAGGTATGVHHYVATEREAAADAAKMKGNVDQEAKLFYENHGGKLLSTSGHFIDLVSPESATAQIAKFLEGRDVMKNQDVVLDIYSQLSQSNSKYLNEFAQRVFLDHIYKPLAQAIEAGKSDLLVDKKTGAKTELAQAILNTNPAGAENRKIHELLVAAEVNVGWSKGYVKFAQNELVALDITQIRGPALLRALKYQLYPYDFGSCPVGENQKLINDALKNPDTYREVDVKELLSVVKNVAFEPGASAAEKSHRILDSAELAERINAVKAAYKKLPQKDKFSDMGMQLSFFIEKNSVKVVGK